MGRSDEIAYGDGEAIASPCTGVCQLLEDRLVCGGCFRTLEAIAAWPTADRAAREAILREAQALRVRLRTKRTAALP